MPRQVRDLLTFFSSRRGQNSERTSSPQYITAILEMRNVLAVLFIMATPCLGNKTVLRIGTFYTFDISEGGWQSVGALPAILMALNDVNNNPGILQNYTLDLSLRDTKVN